MIPEGLLNYLALLGWAISPDEDIFTAEEMIKAFDIHDVNPNPARFDIKKATAINADHIRMLDPADFKQRIVPFLHRDSYVSAEKFDDLNDREKEIIEAGAPLIQTRIRLLGEAGNMLGPFFVETEDLEFEEKAVGRLKENAPEVLDAGIEVIEGLDSFTTEALEEALRGRIVEEMEIKPRLAFGPLRTAISGRQVSHHCLSQWRSWAARDPQAPVT